MAGKWRPAWAAAAGQGTPRWAFCMGPAAGSDIWGQSQAAPLQSLSFGFLVIPKCLLGDYFKGDPFKIIIIIFIIIIMNQFHLISNNSISVYESPFIDEKTEAKAVEMIFQRSYTEWLAELESNPGVHTLPKCTAQPPLRDGKWDKIGRWMQESCSWPKRESKEHWERVQTYSAQVMRINPHQDIAP